MNRAILLLILFAISYARADGIKCYDSNNVVVVEAPAGWIADYDTAKKLGLCVLFYPKGFSFDNAPIVFYPSFGYLNLKDKNEKIELESYIKEDLKSFKKKAPKLITSSNPSYTNKNGLKFTIKKILNGPAPNEFEVIGYLALKKAIFLAVFSSRKEADFKKYENSINEVLDLVHEEQRRYLFADQKAKALKDSASEPGKSFETEFMKSIGDRFALSMNKCVKKDDVGFNAVIQITEAGQIQDWINENESPKSSGSCMKIAMKNKIGAKPPFAPFHIFLTMKITP